MKAKRFSEKFLAIALLVALGSMYIPTTYTPRAEAIMIGLDTGDVLAVPVKSYTEAAQKMAHTGVSVFGVPVPFTSLDSVMKMTVKQINERLSREILSWINTGNSGNPYFEANLNIFLGNVQNQVGSNYLAQNSQNFCGSFRDDLTTALQIQYSIGDAPGASGGGNGCPIENSVGQDKLNTYFAGDFVGGGGWDTWTDLTQNDQNNPYGAYLVNRGNMGAEIARQQAIEREKLAWGRGVHSVEDANGNVTVPATAVESQLNFVLTSDMRQLENAKTFDDIVTVLANTMISKTINNAGGLLTLDLSMMGSGDDSGSNGNRYLRPDYEQVAQTADSPLNQTQNVAPLGTAKQSSTIYGDQRHAASVALTGSGNRNIDYGVSITSNENNPWWQVDLGEEKPITSITLTPSDDDDYALRNAYVYISHTDFPATGLPPEGSYVWRSVVIFPDRGGLSVVTVTPPPGTSGRFVRVQEVGTNTILSLAGVQVFALNVPVITLIGANPMTVARGSQFIDPGVSAIDKSEGDISSKIQTTGVVNTSAPGTYTLTYTVTNASGISAKPVVRTVIVQ